LKESHRCHNQVRQDFWVLRTKIGQEFPQKFIVVVLWCVMDVCICVCLCECIY
jgi:hypothetical protein